MKTHLVLLGSAITALSCSSGPSLPENTQLVVATQQPTYSPGDNVVVSFTNTSATALLYLSRCYGFLERRSAGAWITIAPASGDIPCRDIAEALAPGSTVTAAWPLSPSLEPGMYRYRFTSISDSTGKPLPEAWRVSNTFTVT